MRFLGSACVLALVALAAAGTAEAAKGDKTIRLSLTSFEPSGSFETSQRFLDGTETDGTLTVNGLEFDGDKSVTFFLSGELGITDILGLEVAISRTEFDVDGRGTELIEVRRRGQLISRTETESEVEGSITAMPVMIGLNIHNRFGRGDLFIGPVLGYVFFDSFDLGGTERNADDDQFAYGWNAGFELGLNKSRSLRASFTVRYLKALASVDIEGFEDDTFNVDPFLVNLGLAYGF